MPRAPRQCPGDNYHCPNKIVSGSYCPEHTEAHWVNGASRTGTASHRAWRKAVLRRAGYRCQIRSPQCIGTATIADHIVPEAEGGKTTLENGQAACGPCHDEKTQAEAARGLRRALGLPEKSATNDRAPF